MEFSDFGLKFSRYSAITHLMDDLSEGLLRDDMIMLGGGNPAAIAEVQDTISAIAQQALDQGELLKAMANYDASQGRPDFLLTLAGYLNDLYGWDIGAQNIALTHGSQSAFFSLFNSFAGKKGTEHKHVLLPIVPEYVGYTDVGIDKNLFVSQMPSIERLEDGFFKYHVDFGQLKITSETGLICVSRPTNPSGNVLTDEECQQLDDLARQKSVPLVLDNAYGSPFPDIVFTDAQPFWNENTILCLSLSKLGLPGVRTGIIVANPEVIKLLANMTAITSLAPGGIGPLIANQLLMQRQMQRLCGQVIQPFYRSRCDWAVNHLKNTINDDRLNIHVPEGAIFLWLWFEGLSITTTELYHQLKKEGLLVLPGKYFFPGQDTVSQHAESCIRMNYVQSKEDVKKGVEILARVLRQYW